MGKISQSPACDSTMERLRTELKDSKGRLKRKKRRKDLDVLRQNVLDMRKSLRRKATKSRGTSFTKLLNKFADKRQENDSRTQPADGKDQRGARICNRLLPKSTAGIFTHGAKGKDIRKANLRLSELDEARLEGNVFKLVNGDESGTKVGLAEKIFDDILNGSADCSKENGLEIVGERANPGASHRRECKEKHEAKQRQEVVLEHRSVKADESERSEADPAGECADKGPKCKRRLFQSKKDDSVENERTNSVESAFSATAHGRPTNDKSTAKKQGDRPINYRDYCWSPITRYRQLATIISAENFEAQEHLNDNPAETLAKIKDRLKIHLRGDGSHAYRTKIRRYLHGSGSSNSRTRPLFFASDQSCIEVQACTYSEVSESSSSRYFRELRLDIHAEDCEEAILQKGDDLVSLIPANREAEQSETINEPHITSLPAELFERPGRLQDNSENVPRLGDAGIERASHDSRDRNEIVSFIEPCDSVSLKNFVESNVTMNSKRYLLARYLDDVDVSIGTESVPMEGRNLSRDDCHPNQNPGRARGGPENSRHVPAILRRANNNHFAKTDGAGLIDNANPSDEDCRVVFAKVPLSKNLRNQDAEESHLSARSWRNLRKEEDFLAPGSASACQRELRIMPSSRCVKRSRRKESFPAQCRANVRRYSQESREQGVLKTSLEEIRPDFANPQGMLRLQDGGNQERNSNGKNLRSSVDMMMNPQNQYCSDADFMVRVVTRNEVRPILRSGDSASKELHAEAEAQSQYYPDPQFTIQLVNRNGTRPDFHRSSQHMLSSHDNCHQDKHADAMNYRTGIDRIASQPNQYYLDPNFTLQLVNKSDSKPDYLTQLQDTLSSQDNTDQDKHSDLQNYRTNLDPILEQEHDYFVDPQFTIHLVNKIDAKPDYRANLQHMLYSEDNGNQNALSGIKNFETNISTISKPQDQYYDDPEFTLRPMNKPEARNDFCAKPPDKDNQDIQPDVKKLPQLQLEEEANRGQDALLFEPSAPRPSRGECHLFVAPRQSFQDDKRLEYFARRYGVQATAPKPQTSGSLRFPDSGEHADVGILNSVQNLQFLTLEGSHELPGIGDCVQPDKYLAYENGASCSERIPVYLPDSGVRKSLPRVILLARDGVESDYVFSEKNACRTEVREPELLSRVRRPVGSLQRRVREAGDANRHQGETQTGQVGEKASGRQEVNKQVRQMNKKIGVLVPKGRTRKSFATEGYLSRANQGCADDNGVAQFQTNGVHPQSKYTKQKESKTVYTMYPKSNL